MAGFSQGHQRPLLPASQLQPSAPPRPVIPRRPRVGVSVACETCRKRKIRCNGSRPTCSNCLRIGSECSYAPAGKDHELRRQFEDLQIEKLKYQRLVDMLRSRDNDDAGLILDLLRQNISVHDVLRQVEHDDILCELSLVSEPKHSPSSTLSDDVEYPQHEG